MSDHYILDAYKNVVAVDMHRWAVWFQNEDRKVGLFKTKHLKVSTVFLGLDHRFGDQGPPLIFETMVFAEDETINNDMDRCSTWAEAVEIHHEFVRKYGMRARKFRRKNRVVPDGPWETGWKE